MNSSENGPLISTRLSALKSYYSEESYIWDIGCDHGALGTSFIHEKAVRAIHLVDPSLPVIERLKNHYYKDSYISAGKLKIIHKKGQELKIDCEKNLIYIAGMGGKEIGEIVNHLLPMLNETSTIVISPHRRVLELRLLLHKFPISLEREEVVMENGQFYPILSLNPDSKLKRRVSIFGEAMWDSEIGQHYRQHQIKFFSSHRDELSKEYVEYLKTYN